MESVNNNKVCRLFRTGRQKLPVMALGDTIIQCIYNGLGELKT